MISPMSSAVITGGIVAATNLVDKRSVSPKQLIGFGVYLIGLAALTEVDRGIAEKFALIALIAVLFNQAPKLAKGTGLA